ncbi:hypothetical protein M0R45_035766 [Rubus argutus]|uniref:Uncharacterized protein n=1 Tax=Rubus argutus TaxID=59490 RepID=A0AAW1VXW5_RUBAR
MPSSTSFNHGKLTPPLPSINQPEPPLPPLQSPNQPVLLTKAQPKSIHSSTSPNPSQIPEPIAQPNLQSYSLRNHHCELLNPWQPNLPFPSSNNTSQPHLLPSQSRAPSITSHHRPAAHVLAKSQNQTQTMAVPIQPISPNHNSIPLCLYHILKTTEPMSHLPIPLHHHRVLCSLLQSLRPHRAAMKPAWIC